MTEQRTSARGARRVLPARLPAVTTKYRHRVLPPPIFNQWITRDLRPDSRTELAEFNREANHVHLLVNLPPTAAISRLVNSLNDVSSRTPRQEFPDLAPNSWRANPLRAGVLLRRLRGRRPDLRPASTSSSRPPA